MHWRFRFEDMAIISSNAWKDNVVLLRWGDSEEKEANDPRHEISEMAQGLRRTKAHHDFHGEPVSKISVRTDMRTVRKRMSI